MIFLAANHVGCEPKNYSDGFMDRIFFCSNNSLSTGFMEILFSTYSSLKVMLLAILGLRKLMLLVLC